MGDIAHEQAEWGHVGRRKRETAEQLVKELKVILLSFQSTWLIQEAATPAKRRQRELTAPVLQTEPSPYGSVSAGGFVYLKLAKWVRSPRTPIQHSKEEAGCAIESLWCIYGSTQAASLDKQAEVICLSTVNLDERFKVAD